MSEMLFYAAAVLLIVCLGLYLAGYRPLRRTWPPFVLPPGVALTPAPLLTEAEVVLYNMIRLAVQDHYLILAQVPLWSFISVEAMGPVRAQVLNQIALKRVDFVLVHPGSRRVEQVLQIEEGSLRPHQTERQRVIEVVLEAAGIKLVKLRTQQSYRVPDLAAHLGFAPEE